MNRETITSSSNHGDRGLAFRGVTKSVSIDQQQDYRILNNISGVIYSSQMMALMGLSGCGKTSLLHILSGHVPRKDYEGDILLDGDPLTKAQKREISLVRQEDVFYPHLTVREHLAFTALLRFQGPAISSSSKQAIQDKEEKTKNTNLEISMTADGVQRTLTSLIHLLSMEKFADTQIRFISGGEKKRCSIASELLTRPRLLLLDEAASGLDSAAAASLMDTLRVIAEGESWEELARALDGDEIVEENEHLPENSKNNCEENQKQSPIFPQAALPAKGTSAFTPPVATATLNALAIVMSVHQPSPLLLNSFDKVMILAEGCVVYYGSPQAIETFTRDTEMQCLAACARLTEAWQHNFEIQLNKHCSRGVSPLDFIIERLASKQPWIKESSTAGGDEREEEHGVPSEEVQGEGEAWQDMSYETAVWFMLWPRYSLIHIYDDTSALQEYDEYCACAACVQSQDDDEEMVIGTTASTSTQPLPAEKNTQQETGPLKLPFSVQFCVLLQRALVLTSRSSWATTSSLVETLLIAIIGGLCWWNTRLTENSVSDLTGFLSFSTTFWFFSSLYIGLMDFFPERHVMQKERDSGSYQLSAFVLSKFVANLPLRVFLPVLYILIAYPMAFHDASLNSSSVSTFFSILGIIILASQSGESIGLVIGTISSSMEVAMSTATTVSLSMLIFGGFYKQNFSPFLAWLSSFSALRYSFDASVQVAISAHNDIACDGGLYIPACYGQDTVSSTYVLDWLQVSSHSAVMNVVYLVVLATGLRLVAYLCLRFNSYRPARGY